MSERRVGSILSLLKQGFELDVTFGTRSLESLLRIAEIVEESVYVPGSLSETERGLRFVLANPPLRVGAFRTVRVLVNGQSAPPSAVRFRCGTDGPWRPATSLTRTEPVELLPGRPTEFEVDLRPVPVGEVRVRLELENVAIPPLVWFEIRERIRAKPEAP